MSEKPATSAYLAFLGLKFFIGGFILIGLGLSQGATGWISSATWTRFFYPLVCTPLGLLLSYFGFNAIRVGLFGEKSVSDVQDEEG